MARCIYQNHLADLYNIRPRGVFSLEALVNSKNFVKEARNQGTVGQPELSEKLEDEMLVLLLEVKEVIVEFLNIVSDNVSTFKSFWRSWV